MGMGILLIKCFGGSSRSSSSSTKQPSTSVEYLCHRFSLSQLRKSTHGFDESLVIGVGPHGVVYKASISINGQLKDIVLKRLRQNSYAISLYKNEIIFMCQLHHPNLLSLVGFYHDDHSEMIVVYDYAPNGSLSDLLHSKSPTLSWIKRLEISIGVACGLHYLHSGTKRTIINRNIAPSTILLDENWVPKISFFTLSLKGPKFSAKEAKPLKLESVEGPCGYIAPECFSVTNNVTYKCDVYSFGVVLLELICGKTLSQISQLEGHPIDKNASTFSFTISVVKKVRSLAAIGNGEGIIDERLVGKIEAECWKLYMDITESCLSEDPNERPDMGDVELQLEHVLQLQEELKQMPNQAPHALFI